MAMNCTSKVVLTLSGMCSRRRSILSCFCEHFPSPAATIHFSMFGIFEIFHINSWCVLTMRSGGGVLLMKHLIWPFSPCKACCVCVLEIVGGPERKLMNRVIFLSVMWHLPDIYKQILSWLLWFQAGTPVLGNLGLLLKTTSEHHSTQTS